MTGANDTTADGGHDAGFFERVLDDVDAAVGVYDDTGHFTYVNEAYAEMLDRDAGDLVGSGVWSVDPDVDEDRFERHWESFDLRETRRTETVRESVDGSQFPVEVRTTAIEANGDRYHVDTVADVSERVEGWRELERQDERLEQFASVVSHDLRNPLNVAMGRLRLVEEECESEHIEPVADSLERMEELIDDVLTLTREGGRIAEPERVSLREAAVTAWASTGGERATLDVADDLGVVRSDESRLCEVFENLFRNAVEHGGPAVAVRVAPLADGDGFYVADDGTGVDEDLREDVFEYGYSTDDRGTGFGLAIVDQIADAHGWTVELTESERGGARFEFTGTRIE